MIIQNLTKLLAFNSLLIILLNGCNGDIAPTPKKSKIKATTTNPTESAPLDPVVVKVPVVVKESELPEIEEIEQPFNLLKTYTGSNLIMVFPHPRHFGVVSIRENDAKALYSSIAYEEKSIKQMDPKTFALEKRGLNISCFRYTFADQKDANGENLVKYNCQFYMDYKNGTIVYDNDETMLPEENAKELEESYLGNNLVLIAKHPASFGVVSFKGDDAKALFDTLAMDATPTETSTEIYQVDKKEGKNVSCYRETHHVGGKLKRDYSCNFYIDYKFGSIREKRE